MNKIAVIGSSSFVGKSLVDNFLTIGDSVIGFNRSNIINPVLNSYTKNKNISNLELIQADLNHDIDVIVNKIKEFRPNIIIDAAGQGMVAESWLDPKNWFKTNLVSKAALFKEILDCTFLEKYIRISTPEVYGSSLKKLQTNSAFNPSTPYAISHASVDMLLNAYYKENNFPIIIARFANFYGPEQQFYRIIPKSIIKCMRSEKLELHGGGISMRSFIYQSDFVSAINAVIEYGKIGNVYHFSDNDIYKIKDVVKIICEQLDEDYYEFVMNQPDRPAKDLMYNLDISSSKTIGWAPKINLNDGIDHTIKWIESNKSKFLKMSTEYRYIP